MIRPIGVKIVYCANCQIYSLGRISYFHFPSLFIHIASIFHIPRLWVMPLDLHFCLKDILSNKWSNFLILIHPVPILRGSEPYYRKICDRAGFSFCVGDIVYWYDKLINYRRWHLGKKFLSVQLNVNKSAPLRSSLPVIVMYFIL